MSSDVLVTTPAQRQTEPHAEAVSRNRRQQATFRKVLAAAMATLREKSYADLTVRLVAARAKVAPATAYTYFSSKNHLIAEVYLDLVRQVPCVTDVNVPMPIRVTSSLRHLALVVAVSFAVAGFSWFDGYTLVQQRYWQGIAKDRPFGYWSWANLACVVCAIGLGSVAGLSRVFDRAAISRRSGCHLLLLAVLAAIALADLSMLSKAETERIWLPFTIWLTAAPALLPPRSHRLWLAVNAAGALLLNSIIFTNW